MKDFVNADKPDDAPELLLQFGAVDNEAPIDAELALGVAVTGDSWVGIRCGYCETGYGQGVQMPIVVLDGFLPAQYFDSDICAEDAGYRAAARLRKMIVDYGLGNCVVVDGSGVPVDAATFEKYARGERWYSPLGIVDAGDPSEMTASAREFFEFLAGRDRTEKPTRGDDASDRAKPLLDLSEIAREVLGE